MLAIVFVLKLEYPVVVKGFGAMGGLTIRLTACGEWGVASDAGTTVGGLLVRGAVVMVLSTGNGR